MTVIKRKPRRTYRVQLIVRFDDREQVIRGRDVVARNLLDLTERLEESDELNELFDTSTFLDDSTADVDHVTGIWISMEEVTREVARG